MPERAAKTKVVTLQSDALFEMNVVEPDDYPSHYHDHYEMELVIEGSGAQIFNGESFEMKPRDIYLLRPLDYHKITSNGLLISHIQVKESVLPKWILRRLHSFRNPAVFHLNEEQFARFKMLFSLLGNSEESVLTSDMDMSGPVVELIFSYFLNLDSSLAFMEKSFVSKVTYFLNKNNRFTEKVSLEEISQYVGYSKYYISSVFHKEYGDTIQNYIINLRIEYAKKLIVETDAPMEEIVTMCGFSSASNFYSKFSKIVKCSPLKFRVAMRKKKGANA